jgi:hypothetical protein
MSFYRGLVIVALVFLVVIGATSAFAAPPLVLAHQGRLLDAADQPITGTITLIYSLYDSPIGGVALWTEDHPGVVVADGLYTVALGATTPLSPDLFSGSGGGGGGLYLQVQVSGEAPLMPRIRLGSVPAAATSARVSGDIETAPGLIVMGDSLTGNYVMFGEKVNQGLHAAGGALAQGASRITSDCYDDSASIAIDESGVHRLRASSNGSGGGGGGGSVQLRLSNRGLLGSSGQDGVSLLSEDGSDAISVVRLNGLPPGTPVIGRALLSSSSISSSISLGDVDADGSLDFRCSADSVTEIHEIHEGGVLRTLHSSMSGKTGASSRVVHYGDGSSFTGEDQDCDGISSRLAIQSKGTSAKRTMATMTSTVDGGSSMACDVDVDGDGIADRSIHEDCDDGNAGIAIDEQGVHVARMEADPETSTLDLSGRRPGRTKYSTITLRTSPDSSRFAQVGDVDGDGFPDEGISQVCLPTGSAVAIQTKGTGADKNRVMSVLSGATPDTTRIVLESDTDGDGVPESSISSFSLPTSSSVAINTKGTGADKGRVVRLKADSVAAASSVEADLDGDGTPDNFSTQVCTADSVTHEVVVTNPLPGGGVALMKAKEKANRTKCSNNLRYSAPSSSSGKDDDCDGLSASQHLFFDSDGDGVPENDVEAVCLPTSSSVAIKTKGTGAEANRAASLVCVGDIDGDGAVDRSVHLTADSTTAGIAIDEPGMHIAAEARKGWDGTIKGNIAIDESGVHRVLFDSDGNGFLSGKVGIGVDTPTHSIDVSGGAYCDGTNWVNASDANVKENFEPVDGATLLNEIAQLDVTRWNYKGNTGTAHIGPTAQDFQATFGVGSDGKSISTIDPSGIALAAIKELNKRNNDLAQQNAELAARLEKLQQLVDKLAEQNNQKSAQGR